MKTLKFSQFQYVLAILVFILISNPFVRKADAQQQDAQWPFYLAFEDALGAKDTIWMIYDTSAVNAPDINPEWGQIPLDDDNHDFHVWIYLNYQGNHYNTNAQNFSFEWQEKSIYADNYVLPITVGWDSSLFHSEVLYANSGYYINHAIMDNEYLFMNGGSETGWNMLDKDSVELPYFWWGSSNHFPLFFSMSFGPENSGVGIDNLHQKDFSLFPNPATDYVLLSFPKMVTAQLRMYDVNGRLVRSSSISGDRKRVNVDDLESGLYFIEIQDENGSEVKKLMVK